MRFLALAVTLVLALGACRDADGSDGNGRTTIPTAPSSTTTTTTGVVSYAVPETIDAAYIEKVMAALDHLYGDLARHVASSHQLDEEFHRYLVTLHGADSFDLEKQVWVKVAAEDFRLLRPHPGDAKTTVERIIVARPDCILFEAKRDFFAVFNERGEPGPPRFVGLVPLPEDRNLDRRNRTPWIITFDGRFKDGGEPTPEEACLRP